MYSKPRKKLTNSGLSLNTQTMIQFSRKVFIEANVNGFSNIAQAKGKTGMFLWSFILIFALVGWLYQTAIILKSYYEYPTVVHIGVEKQEEMPFPAVTICNVNRIRRSVFCERFKDKCTYNNAGKMFNYLDLTDQEIFNLTMQYLKEGNKSVLGHQLNDMIVKCEFTGEPALNTEECMELFIPFYDPKVGNCFSLSSGRNSSKSLYVTEPNLWQDMKEMTLILNVEPSEYLSSDTAGMMVTIHEDMTFPNIFSDGLHVHAKQIYNIAVTKVTVTLLEKPYKSNCTNYDSLPFHGEGNITFTPRMCTVQCVNYIQQTECGHHYVTDNVAIFYDKLPYDPDTLTKEDIVCGKKVSNSSMDYCNSLCSIPCHDVSYSLSVDLTPKKNKMVTQDDIQSYKNRTSFSGETPLTVSVHIHYKEMEHKVYNHTPQFNTEQLFSYIGGITGGWLGISLLDFCAFAECILIVGIYTIVYCKPCKKRKRRKVFSKVKHRRIDEANKVVPINRKGYPFEFPRHYYPNPYY